MFRKLQVVRNPKLCLSRRSMLFGLSACRLIEPKVASSSGPPNFPNSFATVASRAIEGLLKEFWVGAPTLGNIRPTWNGYTADKGRLPDQRGSLWERAMLYNSIFCAYQIWQNKDLAVRLHADWNWTKAVFNESDLTTCGQAARANWASDDTGWNSLLFLQSYQITSDPFALKCAATAVRTAYKRWADGSLGGGVWYSDQRVKKTLYETTLAFASLEIYRLTKIEEFLDYAIASENWVRKYLRRPDALYWCTFGARGPEGLNRPLELHPGDSVTYLGGNMAICIIQMRLANLLKNHALKENAQNTAEALALRLVDKEGVFLDDRDAWTNGYFAPCWAHEVIHPRSREAQVLKQTAEAISTRDRFATDFFGPDWDGVSSDSKWALGPTRPQQLMTSANAATVIVGAAALE